jgi:hypothetical protein
MIKLLEKAKKTIKNHEFPTDLIVKSHIILFNPN